MSHSVACAGAHLEAPLVDYLGAGGTEGARRSFGAVWASCALRARIGRPAPIRVYLPERYRTEGDLMGLLGG